MDGNESPKIRFPAHGESYFSTLLPPPNLTGILHLGHMWNAILQDTLIRFHRTRLPKNRCHWAVGVDHAGISLQIRAEEEFRKIEKKDRSSVSDEVFCQWMRRWAEDRRKYIQTQYDRLGYFDTKNLRYTLDDRSRAFCEEAFRRLYREGLIYRAKRLVNWDSKLKTAISDAEVEYRTVQSKLYTIKYFHSDTEYIPVATTRPETIFGDIAVFVHPEDERYKHLIGKEVVVPLTDRRVPVMADSYVDPEFGTGAMKCTPAHDRDDGRLGDKHQLESIQVFDENLIMTMGPAAGKGHMEAREETVRELERRGFLEKEEDYETNVSYSARSGGLVETLLSTQWFLRSAQMAYEAWMYWRDHRYEMEMVNASQRGRLEAILKGTEDWCISRQLLWGIRIPAYIRAETNEISLEPKEGFEECRDVLDTWFSSSLWPLILCEGDMFAFSAIVSGKDILLFWISRMVFMCYFLRRKLPFRRIFLHGLVLDAQKRKMSKSLNNGVDPMELLDRFDHDAIRLFFLSNTRDAKDIAFAESKLDFYAKLMHKMNNVSKFVEGEKGGEDRRKLFGYEEAFEDELNCFYVEFFGNLEKMDFAKAVSILVDFFRETFCNRFLETYKVFRRKQMHNPGYLLKMWGRMMGAFEVVIPGFAKAQKSVTYFGAEGQQKESGTSPYQLYWWFEYLKIFTELKKSLGIAVGTRVKARVYVDHENKYRDVKQYLAQIDHEVEFVKPIGERRPEGAGENALVVAVYPENTRMVLELDLGREMAEKYRKIVEEKIRWLKKEIDFLSNRIRGFNHRTPRHLKRETQEKLDRYREDLRCFELHR